MTVGIPGTGIGGLFYFVLVALMPFYELYRTVRGKSSLARWRRVGFHASVLAGMFTILWVEAWAIRGLVYVMSPGGPDSARAADGVVLRSGQFAALTSMVVLATLLVGAGLLRRARFACA